MASHVRKRADLREGAREVASEQQRSYAAMLDDHGEEDAHSVAPRTAPASRWQRHGLAREGTCGARNARGSDDVHRCDRHTQVARAKVELLKFCSPGAQPVQ